jgi:hypothetical protein
VVHTKFIPDTLTASTRNSSEFPSRVNRHNEKNLKEALP